LRTRTALAVALLLASPTLVGCGPGQGVDPTPHPDVTGADAEVKLVERDEADLVLHVSNQSFDDEEVRLRVAVDGVTVVDGDFHVEDQHNWVTFPLGLSPGDHEITVESDSGATLSESFEVPGDQPRFAIVDHWGEGDSSDLTWSFHRKPVAFG
jgi:hypothetical protein